MPNGAICSFAVKVPIYRYQRFPGNPAIAYENRLQLNLTLSTSRGPWKPILRTLIEGRFPDDRPASARFRFRPGVEYTLPLRTAWRPVVVVNDEFFLVPGNNPFPNGGSSYTQNRFQIGVRMPVTDWLSVRPYYLLQSVNLPGSSDGRCTGKPRNSHCRTYATSPSEWSGNLGTGPEPRVCPMLAICHCAEGST